MIDIPYYPGYKLTEDFQVIGKKGFPLSFSGSPYQLCNVFVNGKSSILYKHRAIALVHVPGYFEGAEVDHKDRDPTNNHPSNLRWVTPAENAQNISLEHVEEQIRLTKMRLAKLERQRKMILTLR